MAQGSCNMPDITNTVADPELSIQTAKLVSLTKLSYEVSTWTMQMYSPSPEQQLLIPAFSL